MRLPRQLRRRVRCENPMSEPATARCCRMASNESFGIGSAGKDDAIALLAFGGHRNCLWPRADRRLGRERSSISPSRPRLDPSRPLSGTSCPARPNQHFGGNVCVHDLPLALRACVSFILLSERSRAVVVKVSRSDRPQLEPIRRSRRHSSAPQCFKKLFHSCRARARAATQLLSSDIARMARSRTGKSKERRK